MNSTRLSPSSRHSFELAGLAEAWLSHPNGHPREIRKALNVLAADEKPEKVFHIFLGNWLGISGLLFFTDRRLIYAPRRPLRPVVSIPFDAIKCACVISTPPRNLNLKIETTANEAFGFWGAVGGRRDFDRVLDALREKIGDRFSEELVLR